jgi:hypothetical protein
VFHTPDISSPKNDFLEEIAVQEEWPVWAALIPKMEAESSSETSVIYKSSLLLIPEKVYPH